MTIRCLTLAAFAAAFFATAYASAQDGRQPRNEQLVLMTYPVGDIVLDVADYPGDGTLRSNDPAPGATQFQGGGGLGGGGGGFGGGGGAFSVPDPGMGASAPATRRFQFAQFGGGGRGGMGRAAQLPTTSVPAITMDSLIDSIVTCIANKTWAENGTGDGEITVLGSMLVVSQTPSVHEQIERFLTLVRRDAGMRKTLTIDARWLMLNSDDLTRLVAASDQTGPSRVNSEALEEFTRHSNSLRAITNCYSGQLVHVVSGTQKNFVTSHIPVVGSVDWLDRAATLAQAAPSPFRQAVLQSGQSGARVVTVSDTAPSFTQSSGQVGYQPIVTMANLGVLLEIRPTVVKDADSVIVDLASTLKFSAEGSAKPEHHDPMLAPPVDRMAVETARLATTLRVPLGQAVLVGGMSYSPAKAFAANQQPTAEKGEPRQAYLVLKVQ